MVIAIVVMILVAVGTALLWNALASRSRRSPFKERTEMTLDELYSQYYSGSDLRKEIVADALRDISETLGVPLGKLRPTDRFHGELNAPAGWEYDDGLGILSSRAEKKLANKDLSPTVVTSIETVDDYIRLMSV